MPQVTSESLGCGQSVETPEQRAARMSLHNSADDKAKADLSSADVKYPNNIKHLFDDRPGHLVDTPENRQQIMDLVKDVNNFVTKDRHGKFWFGKILPNEKQLWAHVINDVITNCGLNDIPIESNPDSGFSRPNKPQQ